MRARLLLALAPLCGLVALAACDRMAKQSKQNPYETYSLTETPRRHPPPAGTVAREDVEAPPPPVTEALLERGRQRFDIYCAPCHGRTGEGNGMVVQRGFRKPPSYHEDRLRNAPVGYFFDVMTHGFGAMQDYSAQVPVADRWAIAAYIRALQLSQRATTDDVPADHRADLDRPAAQQGAGEAR